MPKTHQNNVFMRLNILLSSYWSLRLTNPINRVGASVPPFIRIGIAKLKLP